MFFEATYVPSPTLSAKTLEDDQKTIEELEDKAVDHLIFVIHGIGQQTEQYGHFYEHLENMQEAIRQVLQNKIPDHNVRIELIPIEWHRHIHEQVDPIMHKITLKSIPTIRLIENEYLADVLFYFSKDKSQKIVNNVTQLFNTSYTNFMEKHPDFNGKIIILGYSLGGIITWDILANQIIPKNDEELAHYQKLDIQFPKLKFKPHYFFGLGSPIGAVLTFRGQSPVLYHPDPDIHFENIFHPFDPLGYRIEPLFSDDFIDQAAVLVERSFPIGPSFSFPSMPSLPTGGFFSFFTSTNNRKHEEQTPSSVNIEESDDEDDGNDEEDVEGELEEELEEEEEEKEGKRKSKYSVTSIMHYFSKNKSTKQTDTRTANDIGIITWDPIKDERDPIISLTNESDSLETSSFDHLSISSSDDDKQQQHGRRPSNPFDHLSVSSNDGEVRRPSNARSEGSRHMVEMLGIDGVKLDSSMYHQRQQQQDEGNQNIWVDLNNELHKPGPAITKPGESREKIAKDATVDDNIEKDKVEIDLNSLPGKRRMDHVLQPDSVMSMIANEYLVGLRAHFSYWTNKDFIWHMLRKIEDAQN